MLCLLVGESCGQTLLHGFGRWSSCRWRIFGGCVFLYLKKMLVWTWKWEMCFFQTKQTKQIFWNKIALPEMNMAPKNRPSQKEIHLPTTIFQVQAVTFREGACQSPTKHRFQCQDLISIEFRRWMTSWKGQFQVSYCWATGTPDLSPIRLEKQSRVEYPKIYVHRFQRLHFDFKTAFASQVRYSLNQCMSYI